MNISQTLNIHMVWFCFLMQMLGNGTELASIQYMKFNTVTDAIPCRHGTYAEPILNQRYLFGSESLLNVS